MSKTDKLEQKKEDCKDFLAGKDKSGPYEGLTTRQIVLQKSLELFSMQGFAAVSMRNIADAAGIRASSIYHHFKGKQELFDALVEQVNGIKDHLKINFLTAFDQVETIEEDPFVRSGIFFLTGFLKNPQVAPLLQVLEAERFHNESAEKAWKELLFLAPMEHELLVFQKMKERGMLQDIQLDALAAEYQAMIVFAYFSGDLGMLEVQLRRFYKRTVKC